MRRSTVLKINSLLLIGLFMVTTGFQCKLASPKEQALLKPVELAWWGTFDNPEDLNDLIGDYSAIHPNIRITYRKLREEEFEQALLDALAEDRGPDIVSVTNVDLDKWLSKLAPLPDSTELAYQYTKTSLGLKEETVVEVRKNASLTPAQLHEQFLDVVYGDVVRGGGGDDFLRAATGLYLPPQTRPLHARRGAFRHARLRPAGFGARGRYHAVVRVDR